LTGVFSFANFLIFLFHRFSGLVPDQVFLRFLPWGRPAAVVFPVLPLPMSLLDFPVF